MIKREKLNGSVLPCILHSVFFFMLKICVVLYVFYLERDIELLNNRVHFYVHTVKKSGIEGLVLIGKV